MAVLPILRSDGEIQRSGIPAGDRHRQGYEVTGFIQGLTHIGTAIGGDGEGDGLDTLAGYILHRHQINSAFFQPLAAIAPGLQALVAHIDGKHRCGHTGDGVVHLSLEGEVSSADGRGLAIPVSIHIIQFGHTALLTDRDLVLLDLTGLGHSGYQNSSGGFIRISVHTTQIKVVLFTAHQIPDLLGHGRRGSSVEDLTGIAVGKLNAAINTLHRHIDEFTLAQLLNGHPEVAGHIAGHQITQIVGHHTIIIRGGRHDILLFQQVILSGQLPGSIVILGTAPELQLCGRIILTDHVQLGGGNGRHLLILIHIGLIVIAGLNPDPGDGVRLTGDFHLRNSKLISLQCLPAGPHHSLSGNGLGQGSGVVPGIHCSNVSLVVSHISGVVLRPGNVLISQSIVLHGYIVALLQQVVELPHHISVVGGGIVHIGTGHSRLLGLLQITVAYRHLILIGGHSSHSLIISSLRLDMGLITVASRNVVGGIHIGRITGPYLQLLKGQIHGYDLNLILRSGQVVGDRLRALHSHGDGAAVHGHIVDGLTVDTISPIAVHIHLRQLMLGDGSQALQVGHCIGHVSHKLLSRIVPAGRHDIAVPVDYIGHVNALEQIVVIPDHKLDVFSLDPAIHLSLGAFDTLDESLGKLALPIAVHSSHGGFIHIVGRHAAAQHTGISPVAAVGPGHLSLRVGHTLHLNGAVVLYEGHIHDVVSRNLLTGSQGGIHVQMLGVIHIQVHFVGRTGLQDYLGQSLGHPLHLGKRASDFAVAGGDLYFHIHKEGLLAIGIHRELELGIQHLLAGLRLADQVALVLIIPDADHDCGQRADRNGGNVEVVDIFHNINNLAVQISDDLLVTTGPQNFLVHQELFV